MKGYLKAENNYLKSQSTQSQSVSKSVLATETVHNCLQDRRYLQKSLNFVSRRGYKVEVTFLYWYSST